MDLDKQVREYIANLRYTGTSINTSVVTASAEGILRHENADLLSMVDLKGWPKYLLQRMCYVKHKATTKAIEILDSSLRSLNIHGCSNEHNPDISSLICCVSELIICNLVVPCEVTFVATAL